MNTTIKAELEAHAYDQIQELHVYNSENLLQLLEDGDLHHKLFNEDYYIIGYYQAKEWLKSHKVDVFEGIDYCKSNEIDHFGKIIPIMTMRKLLLIILYIGQVMI